MKQDDNNDAKPKKRKKIATYHDAAVAAFNYLLADYIESGDVEVQDERQLSKRPMRIDILIIKKNRDVRINSSWGKIFRGHNVVEYKSPVDSPLSVWDFNKAVFGYAGTYSSQEKISLTDMTATIVCFKRPDELFETLKNEFEYKILRKGDGIYYITQKRTDPTKSLAIQIVVSSELKDGDLTLKALRKGIDEATAKKVLDELPVENEGRGAFLDPWWDVMSFINGEILIAISQKEENMLRQQRKLVKLMDEKGLLVDYGRERMQQGMQQMAQQIFGILQQQGYDVNKIKSSLPKEYA